MENVADPLADSAPRFARDALEALSAGDAVGFALYAATSLEHLLKCYLARKHPALVVDGKHVDSLLHACGQEAAAETKRDQVRTISGVESLERVARFLPLIGSSDREILVQLFGVRNGAVHLANTASVDRFVLPFLRVSELLREALVLERGDYWGEYVNLADSTIEEHVEAADLKAKAAVGAAKERFADASTASMTARRSSRSQRSKPTAFAGTRSSP